MFTKYDLRNGDFVLRRNGWVEVAIVNCGVFLSGEGYNLIDEIDDNLSDIHNDSDYDIVAVRRPVQKYDCHFDIFKEKGGFPVYERPKPTKMTLKEICMELGREIELVEIAEDAKSNADYVKACMDSGILPPLESINQPTFGITTIK